MDNCQKCGNEFLQYQEDQWGGFHNCLICGWEKMVWSVSEKREDAITWWQNRNGKREGTAVAQLNTNSITRHKERVTAKEIEGKSEKQLVADMAEIAE